MNTKISSPIKFAVAAVSVGITTLLGAGVDHLSQHQGQIGATQHVQLERVVITASRDTLTAAVASAEMPSER